MAPLEVLELGAGAAALPSIVAASCGAIVTATDGLEAGGAWGSHGVGLVMTSSILVFSSLAILPMKGLW